VFSICFLKPYASMIIIFIKMQIMRNCR